MDSNRIAYLLANRSRPILFDGAIVQVLIHRNAAYAAAAAAV